VKVWCRATLNYAGPGGLGERGMSPVEVEIRDGRLLAAPWTECGFELRRHASAIADWTDDEAIAGVHYGEVEALAREVTGCDAALVSDHVKRTANDTKREREQEPVRLVHSDFAADYGDIVRTSYREVSGRGAATLKRAGVTSDDIEHAQRIVMLQVWRNLGSPRPDLPVAWCDARTVTPADARPFRYTGYVAGGRAFDALAIVAPANADDHGWYGFPDLTSDEAVVFRTYDTELVAENTTWFTPHSAFRDPTVELGQPPRFSIELRVLCLFA
jgi:hypothetical protein